MLECDLKLDYTLYNQIFKQNDGCSIIVNIYREITPLKSQDVFVLLDSYSNGFDYPLHCHPEYELNLIQGISGTRIVGDSTEEYYDSDLVLLGPYLHHKWSGNEYVNGNLIRYRVITIQFSGEIFEGPLFIKERFSNINKMLINSIRGIVFSGENAELAKSIIAKLTRGEGINTVLEFFQLMEVLALSKDTRFLTSEKFSSTELKWDSKRIQTAYNFIVTNYSNYRLNVEMVAKQVKMSNSAFSHFFKKYTNKSFTDFLTDIRISQVCKMLNDSDSTISELAYKVGFNNIANFNRHFKRLRGCTPNEYRNADRLVEEFDWEHQLTPWQFLPPESENLQLIGPNTYSTRVIHV